MTDKKRILIVEDEGIVALEIKTELEAMGYAADSLSSGEEVLENIDRLMPDLILMDIRLRGEMNGIETAARVKKRHDIPVIYLTAHMDEDTIKKAKATGPYGYIVKPLDIRKLQITIEISLYRHEIEKEKEQITRELKDALAKVKQLSGMLPICASCKKIRDDKGYWSQIEVYIRNHSDAEFSHGLCPDCGKKALAELEELKELRNKPK